MKSFYEMWVFLEGYQDVDKDAEHAGMMRMNMTANLRPPEDKDILASIRGLTRGFHLNTIIGRMLQPWITGLEFAPRRWDLYEKTGNKKDIYKWSISETDKRANNGYKAAYSLFKQELANAIQSLPYKQGYDVNAQKLRDILAPAKKFFGGMQSEEGDLIEIMRKAYKIFDTVFGPRYPSQARNFSNFFQIVRDEFMRYKEVLPTMGDDDEEDVVDNEYTQAFHQEAERYYRIERQLD